MAHNGPLACRQKENHVCDQDVYLDIQTVVRTRDADPVTESADIESDRLAESDEPDPHAKSLRGSTSAGSWRSRSGPLLKSFLSSGEVH